jgi:GT2 family glycosyltransferase
MNIVVVIATRGRPEEVSQAVTLLKRQTLAPSAIILSVEKASDVGKLIDDPLLTVIFGIPGLCAQRNRALDALPPNTDLVAFFDDDYLPTPKALEGAAALFRRYSDVSGANGVLLADGINTAGVSYDDALSLIQSYRPALGKAPKIIAEMEGLYGCNMVYRVAAILGERFDEKLPLYGWQEDIDFAARMRKRGRQVKSDAFAGVHRGVKSARLPGIRFGYSQVANPIYLVKKGTMRSSYALRLIGKNILANHTRSFQPEPWVDRPGRVKGNWIALFDIIRGRLRPEAVLDL